MRHGVSRTSDGVYEFHWLGKRLSLEEFNVQLISATSEMKGELDAFAQGMDTGVALDAAKELTLKIDLIESVLRLPFCAPCKKLINESA